MDGACLRDVLVIERGRHLPYYSFRFDNWGSVPASAIGTSLTTSGTANTEGSWTQVASSSDISAEVYWVNLRLSHSYGTGTNRQVLVDVGVDPAGGTSYTEVVANLIGGNSADFSTPGAGHHYYFPLRIRAGSSVAVRAQASAASVAVRASLVFIGSPSRPEMAPAASFSETIGTVTNSSGTSFTPGTSAEGSWVSLGTTAKDTWWHQLGVQVDNATQNAIGYYAELAYGDATNKVQILRMSYCTRTSESMGHMHAANLWQATAYCRVPAGSTLYVRGRSNGAPDTGHNALAYCFGG